MAPASRARPITSTKPRSRTYRSMLLTWIHFENRKKRPPGFQAEAGPVRQEGVAHDHRGNVTGDDAADEGPSRSQREGERNGDRDHRYLLCDLQGEVALEGQLPAELHRADVRNAEKMPRCHEVQDRLDAGFGVEARSERGGDGDQGANDAGEHHVQRPRRVEVVAGGVALLDGGISKPNSLRVSTSLTADMARAIRPSGSE